MTPMSKIKHGKRISVLIEGRSDHNDLRDDLVSPELLSYFADNGIDVRIEYSVSDLLNHHSLRLDYDLLVVDEQHERAPIDCVPMCCKLRRQSDRHTKMVMITTSPDMELIKSLDRNRYRRIQRWCDYVCFTHPSDKPAPARKLADILVRFGYMSKTRAKRFVAQAPK